MKERDGRKGEESFFYARGWQTMLLGPWEGTMLGRSIGTEGRSSGGHSAMI
jgi:hypothetical protein